MAEFSGLPPEGRLPEEIAAPAPGIYPPPEEGAAGTAAGGRSERRRRVRDARQRSKSALLLAAAGVTLCGMIYTAPMKPAAAVEPPAEPVAMEPAAEPAPTEPEPVALTAAERLVEIGTWKNSAESEWVHFNADSTGWWYDGTYFGRMVWEENADGGISYEASIAYIGPGEAFYDRGSFPEKEGDTIHHTKSSGSIELPSDEDRFSCPGLLFGEGSYLPDDIAIDASVMDGICGKSAAELVSGTVWHVTQTSDLGIPYAPSEGKMPYTDQVYVQSIDFSAGILRLTTRDGGLLDHVFVTEDDRHVPADDPARTLDISFGPIEDEEKNAPAYVFLPVEAIYDYYADYVPGDTEYNNLHLLFGRGFNPDSIFVRLLFTASGFRLGVPAIDLYPNNYTILAPD